MSLDSEFRLSFYKDVTVIDQEHDIRLVQHTETGNVYVKKVLQHYDRSVYDALQDGGYRGVPAIREVIEDETGLTVIEEYISGTRLDVLLDNGLFEPNDVIKMTSQLCDILYPLHSHDPEIVHRDIKPSNIILSDSGDLYLIDFDASKVHDPGKTRDTHLIGTEEYAAPEQYGFGQSDRRTDIYAIGVLMNKLLTGKFPDQEKPSGQIGEIISRCISIDPENRYDNVIALRTQLAKVTDESATGEQYSESSFIRNVPGFRTHNILVNLAATLWYLLLIYGMFTMDFYDDAGNIFPIVKNRINSVLCCGSLLLITLYVFNFYGVRSKFPPRSDKIKNSSWDSVIIFLTSISIFILAALIAVILEVVI